MTWEEYYDRYLDWADSTQVSRISQITTFRREYLDTARCRG